MTLSFPADPAAQTPVNTYSPTSTPESTDNGVTYIWNGSLWNASSEGFPDIWNRFENDEDIGIIQPSDFRDRLEVGGDGLCVIGRRVGVGRHPTTGNDDAQLQVGGDVEIAGDVQALSLNGGQLGGFKNQLIGGCFRIWQRGTVGSINGTAYRPDRWQATTVGAGQVQRRTAPNDLPFDYVCEFTANGNGFRQGIELSVNDAGNGQPGPFIPGTTWTLSVYANWDMSGITPVIAFRNTLSNAAGQTVLDSSASNYQAVGPAVDGYTRYSTTITIDAGVAPGTAPMLAVVLIPNGNIPAAARIGAAQFEQSPVPTPFEHRPYSVELAMARRYYQTVSRFRLYPSVTESSTSRFFEAPRPVVMRQDPDEGSDSSGVNYEGTADAYRLLGTSTDLNSGKVCINYTADAEFD